MSSGPSEPSRLKAGTAFVRKQAGGLGQKIPGAPHPRVQPGVCLDFSLACCPLSRLLSKTVNMETIWNKEMVVAECAWETWVQQRI